MRIKLIINCMVMAILFATCAFAKDVITFSDFTFVGGFKTPLVTPWLQGLTYRYKDGDLVLYSFVGAGVNKGNLIEMKVPASLSIIQPFSYIPVNNNYGDIFQDKLVDLVSNGSHNPPSIGIKGGASIPSSPFWDQEDKRMYWTKVVSYDNGIPGDSRAVDAGIGYSTLDDVKHTGAGIGAWKLDQKKAFGGHGTRYAFQMVRIPSGFSNKYLNGRKFVLGFGGGVSVVSNGPPSIGPALSILDHAPNLKQEKHLDYLSSPPMVFLSHFYGEARADLPVEYACLNYRTGDAYYYKSTTKWGVSDESFYGVWIESEHKQGVMAFALTGGGNTLTSVARVLSKSVFTVADIGDIRIGDIIRVASDGALNPTHYPFESVMVLSINGNQITLTKEMLGNSIVGGEVVCGTWYRGGGADVSRMWTPVYIYSEKDIAAVVQGTKSADGLPFSSVVNWSFPGVKYPLPGGAYGASTGYPHVIRGVTFDPATNRLYLMAFGAGGLNDIYVYQLNDVAK